MFRYLLFSFCVVMLSENVFAQQDSLIRYINDTNENIFERAKVAEELLLIDSSLVKANQLVAQMAIYRGDYSKACKCYYNMGLAEKSKTDTTDQMIFGQFICELSLGNISGCDAIIEQMKLLNNESFDYAQERLISYLYAQRKYDLALDYHKKYFKISYLPQSDFFQRRVLNVYLELLMFTNSSEEKKMVYDSLVYYQPTNLNYLKSYAFEHSDNDSIYLATLNKIIAIEKGKNDKTFVQLAKLYRKLGESEKMLENYLQAIKVNPSNLFNYYELSYRYDALTMKKERNAMIDLVLAATPESYSLEYPSDVFKLQALLNVDFKKKKRKAGRLMTQAIHYVESNNEVNHTFKSISRVYLKNSTDFLEIYASNNKIGEYYNLKANIYADQKLHNTAKLRQLYDSAIQYNPSIYEAYFERAKLNLKKEKTKEAAIEDFKEVLKWYAKPSIVAYSTFKLGLYYKYSARESAIEYFKISLENEFNPWIYYLIAETYVELKVYDKAIETIDNVIEQLEGTEQHKSYLGYKEHILKLIEIYSSR